MVIRMSHFLSFKHENAMSFANPGSYDPGMTFFTKKWKTWKQTIRKQTKNWQNVFLEIWGYFWGSGEVGNFIFQKLNSFECLFFNFQRFGSKDCKWLQNLDNDAKNLRTIIFLRNMGKKWAKIFLRWYLCDFSLKKIGPRYSCLVLNTYMFPCSSAKVSEKSSARKRF